MQHRTSPALCLGSVRGGGGPCQPRPCAGCFPGGLPGSQEYGLYWVPGWGARAELQHPACRTSEGNQSSSVAVETGGETQFLAASTSLPGILRSLASGGVTGSPPHFPPLPFAGCPCLPTGAAVVGTSTVGSALFWGDRAAPQLCPGKTLMYFQCICVIWGC